MDVVQISLLFLFFTLSPLSTSRCTAQSFKCMSNNATCTSLVGYIFHNRTTLGSIQSLFQINSFQSLVAANLLPPSTSPDYPIFANQTIRIPFPCRCSNGTGISDRVPIYTATKDDIEAGVDMVVSSVFSKLVYPQQILAVNGIKEVSMITAGQKLWVPLPCSCDNVEGQKVVHYGYLVGLGDSLDQIAAEFGTTDETLLSLNIGPDVPSLYAIRVDAVIDVPLKGQVLNNLATPSEVDEAVMKQLASALHNVKAWLGSDFCIWPGVVCNSKGFVTSISLPSKNLSGTLPSNLNSLSQLTTISLQKNHLSGALPSFANLKLLQEIHLDSNNFTFIPVGIFLGLTRLQILVLDDNPNLFPWAFPAELVNFTILTTFSATNVNLTGSIPDIFTSLGTLQNLKLSSNNLTGSLPASLDGTKIEYLWLDNQAMGLSGPLDVVAGITSLKQVWLDGNKFTGPIPDFSKSTGIFDLQLQNNLLTGVVPPSLMSLPSLLNVSLQSNKFQGPLPVFPESVTVTLGTAKVFCKYVPGDCDPQVMTLLEVAGALGYPLKLAEAWKGNDACNRWAFVTCDASGSITIVNLSKQGFSGTISPALANLTSLRELYLNDNSLMGTIPESLTTLPHLREINVSNNDLRGPVPSFRTSVTVFTAGNKIGLGSKNSKRPFRKTGKILIVLIPTISIIVLLILAKLYKKRKHQEGSLEDEEQWGNISQLTVDSPIRFSYQVLKIATNNFDMHKKLGGGGFGSVFEGSLSDGTKIAVKRLDRLGQGKKEFLAEVQTIGGIHHLNLVKLIGYCAERMHRLLVYEHMSNGSLDKWIFNTSSRQALAWNTKKKVILQIAKGLAYLHEECQKRIAHLDIKPQNVLLDDEFNARLSDFGLAKLIDRDQSYVMTQMRGTRGYLAPEWLSRKITEKVDVYSYGIVALEVVFGRKNLDCSQPEESNLLTHVKKAAQESQLFSLLDKCSEDMQQNSEEIEKIVKLAIWCLENEAARRPTMSMAVKVLEGATIPEAVRDYSLTVLANNGNPAIETTTQISVSILSGPR